MGRCPNIGTPKHRGDAPIYDVSHRWRVDNKDAALIVMCYAVGVCHRDAAPICDVSRRWCGDTVCFAAGCDQAEGLKEHICGQRP
jgi:hypothetical protein